jgi:sialate O-acetylesterase
MTKKLTQSLTAFLTLLFAFSCYAADVKTSAFLKSPSVIANNMVLQQGIKVPLWGWAEVGSQVTVSFAGQTKTAISNKAGRWDLKLDTLKASSENRELTISSGQVKNVYKNVLVGEVWVASGQSNMQWTLPGSDMPKAQLAKLNFPLIRMITFPRVLSATPQTDVAGKWVNLDSKSAGNSSAVASYFAMKLFKELNVPIGVISTSWGGTRIEPWTPAEGFDLVKGFEKEAKGIRSRSPSPEANKIIHQKHIAEVKEWLKEAEVQAAQGRSPKPVPAAKVARVNNRTPGVLYNAMIHPIVGYGIKGAIWYQGESNKGDGAFYEKKKQALILGWRKVWQQGDFPFYHVQLAPYNYGKSSMGPIWEGQFKSIQSIKNTGMAVTTDIGNLRNIHPKNKLDVGNRLAFWALAKDYGHKIVYSGPLYKSFKVDGNKIVISFDHAESGLGFKGEALRDVYVSSDGIKDFVKATVKINGSTLEVTCPDGKKPVHVRMGWANGAQPNLMNKEGLPASPFRTDK